jgi:hypothetical protein
MNALFSRRVFCGTLLVSTLLVTDDAQAGAKKKKQPGERLTDKARIDWQKGVIYATGRGAVSNHKGNAAKAHLAAANYAKYDAIANLLMAIDHVKIDARTIGRDFEADTEIKAEITGIVRGAETIDEKRIPMGASAIIEVTVATPLYGDRSVGSVFLPEAIRRHREQMPDTIDEDDRDDRSVDPPIEEPADALPPIKVEPMTRRVPPLDVRKPRAESRITGVIIDTRGMNLDRSMCPKIRREDGSEVWGTVRADPDYVIEHGIVVYAHSLGQAQNDARAGNNPLVIRATGRARERFATDAVISDDDADRLMELNEKYGFLDKFRVVFLVDAGK